jgi:uncharacterized protein (TIGR00369 family)
MSRLDFRSNGCVICGPENAVGVHVHWDADGDGAVRAEATVPAHFQGFQGMVHGGVITALLDDAMWHAIFRATGVSTVTADLSVRYRHPVPIGQPVRVEARFLRTRHRLAEAEATVQEAREGGLVLAEAHGRFLPEPVPAAEAGIP